MVNTCATNSLGFKKFRVLSRRAWTGAWCASQTRLVFSDFDAILSTSLLISVSGLSIHCAIYWESVGCHPFMHRHTSTFPGGMVLSIYTKFPSPSLHIMSPRNASGGPRSMVISARLFYLNWAGLYNLCDLSGFLCAHEYVVSFIFSLTSMELYLRRLVDSSFLYTSNHKDNRMNF